LIILPTELVEDLCTLGGSLFSERVETLKAWTDYFRFYFPNSGGLLRKLSYFPDKEGKVRVIGILDYFSQSVLRVLHLYLYKVLRKIPQDYTFDQGRFLNTIKDWDEFYSIDLSNATDRFPIKVISQVLKGILPD
jgi:hypothetical protein